MHVNQNDTAITVVGGQSIVVGALMAISEKPIVLMVMTHSHSRGSNRGEKGFDAWVPEM